MKRISGFITVLLLIIAVLLMVGCEKVPAGNVGVKFNLYGSDKGVDSVELPPGRYFINPWSQEITNFPTFTQTRVWCSPPKEGDPDETVQFNTAEGSQLAACIGITYHVDPTKVTKLFQTWRKGIDEITDTYLHNMVRNSLVNRAAPMSVEQVYGSQKSVLLQAIKTEVKSQAAPVGIIVDELYWVGPFGLPKGIQDGINAKVRSTQMAEQRNNEIAQAKAEASKIEAEATGKANAALTIATAEATAIKLRGDALRDNPGVAQLNAIEKWDGHLPQYQLGGTTPFINVPTGK